MSPPSTTEATAPARSDRPRVDPRLRRRRAEVDRAAGRRRLGVLVALLALIATGVLAVVTLHSSLFSARHVTVTGEVATPPSRILQVSGLSTNPPLLDLNTAKAAAAIEQLPWIERATVTRDWPDGATVSVVERRAVASWTVRKGDVLLLDASGRVLEVTTAAPAGLVPVLLGGPVEPPGATLPAADVAVTRVAAEVPLSILHSIVEVEVGPTGVTIGLTSGAVAELGQATDLSAKMVALATLLATPSVVLGPHQSVDLRVPEAPVVSP